MRSNNSSSRRSHGGNSSLHLWPEGVLYTGIPQSADNTPLRHSIHPTEGQRQLSLSSSTTAAGVPEEVRLPRLLCSPGLPPSGVPGSSRGSSARRERAEPAASLSTLSANARGASQLEEMHSVRMAFAPLRNAATPIIVPTSPAAVVAGEGAVLSPTDNAPAENGHDAPQDAVPAVASPLRPLPAPIIFAANACSDVARPQREESGGGEAADGEVIVVRQDSQLSSNEFLASAAGSKRYIEQSAQQNTHQRMRVDLFDDSEYLGCWGSFKLMLKNTWNALCAMTFFLQLTWVDFRARTCTYVLSFCSVFVVVLLCVALLSVLSTLPIVFLRLAEPTAGLADLVLQPGGQMSTAASLNYGLISRILATGPPDVQLHAPRVIIPAYAFTPETCRTDNAVDMWFPFPEMPNGTKTGEGGDGGTSTTTHVRQVCINTCFDQWCRSETGPIVSLYALNSTQENIIGFGTFEEFPWHTPSKGYAVISTTVSDDLGIGVGDDVFFMALGLDGIINQFLAHVPEDRLNYNTIIKLRVGDVASTYSYKFPDTDNFVLVDYATLGEMLAEGMTPALTTEERAAVAATPTDTAATRVYFRMPRKQRLNVYVHSSYKTIRRKMQGWGDSIVGRLGANQLAVTTPILSFLRTTEFFSMFVGLIMSIIILALACLSVLLVYSLLTVGIESRTYDLGIQRMIGFTREGLVVMVLTNAYFFALPAWILGIPAGQLVYSGLRSILAQVAGVTLSASISGASVGWATLAGLLIPLVASIFPILSLVMLKLPEALDVSRGRNSGVVYKIKRHYSKELNGTMLGLGFLFALFGFLLYYLFPNGLMTMNLQLTFYIFFFVLLGMLLGLTLLASNFERVVETVLYYVFFFWESRAVFRMVLKSLAAHRLRNRKTTLMYSTSLAFIIFVTVAFEVQITSMTYQDRRSRGGEVLVDLRSYQRPLPSASSPTSAAEAALYEDVELDSTYDSAGLHPNTYSSNEGGTAGVVISPTYEFRTDPPAFYDLNYGANFYLIDYASLRDQLAPLLQDGTIRSMTYRGRYMLPVAWNLQYMYTQTLGRYSSSTSSINPVPPNLYDTLFSEFVRVDKYDDVTARYGLSGALYTQRGLHSFVVATTTYRVFGFTSMNDPAVCRTGLIVNGTSSPPVVQNIPHSFQTTAVMDSSPIFLMTKFPNNMGESLVSMPAMVRYLGIDYMSVSSIPITAIILRVPKKADYDRVKREITTFMSRNGFYPQVSDIESAVEDLRTGQHVLSLFFIFTMMMILIICFFSLMSSMSSNILESSKEIGVLLCLGMTHFQVYRVYIEESFILVFASGLMGLFIGLIVAYTMQMQNVLFSQLSIPFAFPYIQLCIVVVVGVVSALASSISPVAYLVNLPSVTHILRRTG